MTQLKLLSVLCWVVVLVQAIDMFRYFFIDNTIDYSSSIVVTLTVAIMAWRYDDE